MSHGQWIYEYQALRKKEEDDRKFQVDMMRNVLINTLGLRVPPRSEDGTPKPKEEWSAEDKESFVPLVYLAGNHHLLKKYFEKFPDGEQAPVDPITEAAFEEISRRMADDDGDMVPIVDPIGKDMMKNLMSKQNSEAGVIIIDDTPATADVKISEAPPYKVRHTVSFEESDDGGTQ